MFQWTINSSGLIFLVLLLKVCINFKLRKYLEGRSQENKKCSVSAMAVTGTLGRPDRDDFVVINCGSLFV